MMMVALVRLGMRGTVYTLVGRGMIASGPGEPSIPKIAEPFRPVVTLAIVNLLRDRFQGLVFRAGNTAVRAGVAQLVEHLICNQTVGGSSPFASSRVSFRRLGNPAAIIPH